MAQLNHAELRGTVIFNKQTNACPHYLQVHLICIDEQKLNQDYFSNALTSPCVKMISLVIILSVHTKHTLPSMRDISYPFD